MSGNKFDDDAFDEFKESTDTGTRAEETDAEKTFVDILAEHIHAAEAEPRSRTVTANDPRLWALFKALDEDDDRRREFCNALEIDYNEKALNRSGAVRELIRVGIEEADDDLDAEMAKAVKKNESDDW